MKFSTFFRESQSFSRGEIGLSKGGGRGRNGENGFHNNGGVDGNRRLHNPTAYVNKCNLLLQDIVRKTKIRPISSGRVNIINRILLCKKLSKYGKNQ